MKRAKRLDQVREQWRDPLLTAVTLLLALLMFVVAPLQASGIIEAQEFGFAVALVIIGATVILSGNLIAIGLLSVGVALAATAAILRLQHPSNLDVFLKASAWTLTGIMLLWVVAPAVFASGRITYHRVIGAILLYLAIGWTFAGLFTLVALVTANPFTGMSVSDRPGLGSTMLYLSLGTLTTAGSGDIAPLHPIARSLCNLEAMIGQLYPATLLARLVTLQIEAEAKH